MPETGLRDTVDRYNATRTLSGKALASVCYAPFVSLYFDQVGSVRVCCQNATHPVGQIPHDTLDQIWHGARIRALREALVACDFSRGCRFCEWQLNDGNFSGTFMRRFDALPVSSAAPSYPAQMEFSISNTCNLECVMCNGEWSSSIRARREHLPPLPKVYDEPFFRQLRNYLPHLERALFLGGEPFLAQETLRIWEMMLEDGLTTPCHVTTNGTQFNARVERILEQLPVSLSVSLDGVSRETIESIRRNAQFDAVMTNLRRFHEYTRRRGTYLSLTFCLMRLNWHEFGDYLAMADELDCDVCVNVVTAPNTLSLYTLGRDELAPILRALELQDARNEARLGKNLQVWRDELARLRNRLASREQSPYFLEWGARFKASLAGTEPSRVLGTPEIEAKLRAWSGHEEQTVVRCDARGVVVDVESRGQAVAPADGQAGGEASGLDPQRLVGENMAHIGRLLGDFYGCAMRAVSEEQTDSFIDNIAAFEREGKPTIEIRGITLPEYDETGTMSGFRIYVARRIGAAQA